MVRILPNGDIVQDDDPRVATSKRTQTGPEPKRRIGRIGEATEDNENRGDAQGYQQQPSIFENLNQRLLANGFPRFDIGQYKIEPIVSVGFILAFFLLGVRGILFGAFLFVIVYMSNTPNANSLTQIISSFFNMNGRNRPTSGARANNRPATGDNRR